MKITCSRSQLNEAISKVQRVIPARSTFKLLEGILIEAEDKLSLTGYDMEIGIETKMEADIQEKGRIVAPSKMFGDIIRKLPEEQVELETSNDLSLTIKSGTAKFSIKGMDSIEYPKIPIVEDASRVSVPQKIFKTMINQTIFAASSDEARPILNGVKITTQESKLELVAIDGFRLAVSRQEIEGKNEDLSFIVPWKTLSEVARSLADVDDPVAIYPSHNHIMFETASLRLVSRLIEGQFMEYKNIIPPSCKTVVGIQSRDLLESVERASLIINVEQRRFPITFKNQSSDQLTISAMTDLGHVEETLAVGINGDDVDIDFNPKYFLDVLRAVEDQTIRMELSGPTAPCLIKPAEHDGFLYLILPLRR